MLGSLRRDPAWLMLALGAVALLGYFLLWPVLSMLTSSLFNKEGQFGLHGYVQFFSEPAYRESLFNTLWLGGAVTLLSLVLGAGLALAAARFSFPLAACLGVLPLLTLVIPDVVVAAAWIVVLGKQGVLNSLLAPLGLELPSLYAWWGLVFVMTLNNYVYGLCCRAGRFEVHGSQPGRGGPESGQLPRSHLAHGDLSFDGASFMWCRGAGFHACHRGFWCSGHSGSPHPRAGGQDI